MAINFLSVINTGLFFLIGILAVFIVTIASRKIIKRRRIRKSVEAVWESEKDFFLEDVKNKIKDWSVTILIAAYNEEKGIRRCIESCLRQTRQADKIVVVNDGSKDRTKEILESFGKQIRVINLPFNTGNKSRAQEIGIQYIDTDIFVTTDGDTELDRNFIKEILKSFDDHNISAVSGFVESKRNNWITRVREINYLVGQTIYKKAQEAVDAIFVICGCAAAFKTKDFKKYARFDHDNVTEDLDFTYQLKLAGKKITFNDKAIVYTQDPNNLGSYFKQLYRWYSGGWACLKKNLSILKKPNNALILSPLYLEGLVVGGIVLLAPLLILFGIEYFLYYLFLQFMLTALIVSYGAFRFRRYDVFLYIQQDRKSVV